MRRPRNAVDIIAETSARDVRTIAPEVLTWGNLAGTVLPIESPVNIPGAVELEVHRYPLAELKCMSPKRQIIERLAPRSPLELCLLPPVFMDHYLNDSGGYDVPRLPYIPGAAAVLFMEATGVAIPIQERTISPEWSATLT